jgi:hypothetical protein
MTHLFLAALITLTGTVQALKLESSKKRSGCLTVVIKTENGNQNIKLPCDYPKDVLMPGDTVTIEVKKMEK